MLLLNVLLLICICRNGLAVDSVPISHSFKRIQLDKRSVHHIDSAVSRYAKLKESTHFLQSYVQEEGPNPKNSISLWQTWFNQWFARFRTDEFRRAERARQAFIDLYTDLPIYSGPLLLDFANIHGVLSFQNPGAWARSSGMVAPLNVVELTRLPFSRQKKYAQSRILSQLLSTHLDSLIGEVQRREKVEGDTSLRKWVGDVLDGLLENDLLDHFEDKLIQEFYISTPFGKLRIQNALKKFGASYQGMNGAETTSIVQDSMNHDDTGRNQDISNHIPLSLQRVRSPRFKSSGAFHLKTL